MIEPFLYVILPLIPNVYSVFFTGDIFQGQLQRERRESDVKIVPTSTAVGQEPQITDKRVQAQAKYLVSYFYYVQGQL